MFANPQHAVIIIVLGVGCVFCLWGAVIALVSSRSRWERANQMGEYQREDELL